MRLIVVFLTGFAIGCGAPSSGSSQPLVLAAEPARTGPTIAIDPARCTNQAGSVEVLPAAENGGSARLIAGANGLDMFWTRVTKGGQDARFDLMYASLEPDGRLRGKPRSAVAAPGRHVAAGAPGEHGFTYQVSNPNGHSGRVAVIRDGVKRWDVAVPLQGRSHGTHAIAWDPQARGWVVVGQESFDIDSRNPGYVYDRLFVLRLDETGRIVMPVTYLSQGQDSAQISEWGNPVIWTGDRIAFVWTRFASKPPHAQTAFVTEMVGSKLGHIPLTSVRALMRGVIAKTNDGYTIAGGEQCSRGSLCSRTFAVAIRGGEAGPVRYVSDERMHSSEAVIASDGSRIAIAWHESDLTTGTNRGARVHAGILGANGVDLVASSKPAAGQHDWVHSLVWDGCRFVLAHGVGINPSAIRLVMFP